MGVLNSTLKEDAYTIVVSEEILRSYYLKNRNLEQPFFTEFEELSETQILSIRKDFIRKEVLKREAKSLGLDEVDTIIANRLAQLGELALDDAAALPALHRCRCFGSAAPVESFFCGTLKILT